MIKLACAKYGKVADQCLANAFLPVVGNTFNLIFFIMPGETFRKDLGVLKMRQNLDAFIQSIRIKAGFIRLKSIPARLRAKTILIHIFKGQTPAGSDPGFVFS